MSCILRNCGNRMCAVGATHFYLACMLFCNINISPVDLSSVSPLWFAVNLKLFKDPLPFPPVTSRADPGSSSTWDWWCCSAHTKVTIHDDLVCRKPPLFRSAQCPMPILQKFEVYAISFQKITCIFLTVDSK